MGAKNTGRGIRGRSVTVRGVTTNRLLLIIRGPLKGIVVVMVVNVVVIVSAIALQRIVVSVRVRPTALFVTGRVIRPIAVSLLLTALLTKVANRRQNQ